MGFRSSLSFYLCLFEIDPVHNSGEEFIDKQRLISVLYPCYFVQNDELLTTRITILQETAELKHADSYYKKNLDTSATSSGKSKIWHFHKQIKNVNVC